METSKGMLGAITQGLSCPSELVGLCDVLIFSHHCCMHLCHVLLTPCSVYAGIVVLVSADAKETRSQLQVYSCFASALTALAFCAATGRGGNHPSDLI